MNSPKRAPSGSSRKRRGVWLSLPENVTAVTAVDRVVRDWKAGRGRLLFVVGPAGSGKTLLLQQFVAACRQERSKISLQSLAASLFASSLATARQGRSLHTLDDEFGNVDLLVIDDLQQLVGNEDAQLRLSHLLDGLLSRGAAVALAADHRPGQLKLIPRFRNRCHAAVVAELKPLGIGSRRTLVSQHCDLRELPLAPRLVDLIARSTDASASDLERLIDQLAMHMRRHPELQIDDSLIRQFLGCLNSPVQPAIQTITRTIANHFGLRVTELRSTSRERRLTLPRQVAMYLAREMTSLTVLAISSYFGRDNHSAVSHAHRRLNKRLQQDPVLAQEIEALRKAVLMRA